MASILIVEDDLTLQKSYAQVLKTKGYTVFTAENTSHARTLLSDQQIQLILLDIMLPGEMNGFEFLADLKRNDKFKNIPVIIMTNLDSEKQTGLDMGATDYIVKISITPTALAEKIKQYV